jgi:hypothetical protein
VKDAPASGSRVPSLRWLESKPAGVLRLAFRLTIYLCRLDLGWLFSHRGVRVACGEKVDWYPNIEVTLALEVRTASARYVPEQRFYLVPEAQREVVR